MQCRCQAHVLRRFRRTLTQPYAQWALGDVTHVLWVWVLVQLLLENMGFPGIGLDAARSAEHAALRAEAQSAALNLVDSSSSEEDELESVLADPDAGSDGEESVDSQGRPRKYRRAKSDGLGDNEALAKKYAEPQQQGQEGGKDADMQDGAARTEGDEDNPPTPPSDAVVQEDGLGTHGTKDDGAQAVGAEDGGAEDGGAEAGGAEAALLYQGDEDWKPPEDVLDHAPPSLSTSCFALLELLNENVAPSDDEDDTGIEAGAAPHDNADNGSSDGTGPSLGSANPLGLNAIPEDVVPSSSPSPSLSPSTTPLQLRTRSSARSSPHSAGVKTNSLGPRASPPPVLGRGGSFASTRSRGGSTNALSVLHDRPTMESIAAKAEKDKERAESKLSRIATAVRKGVAAVAEGHRLTDALSDDESEEGSHEDSDNDSISTWGSVQAWG